MAQPSEVPRGSVISRNLAGRPIVIFRGASGALGALPAHCAHMGTHLGTGKVIGDCLRCPLHFWQWDGEGGCHIPGASGAPSFAANLVLPVREHLGGIWVFNGSRPLFSPPMLTGGEGAWRTAPGAPVHLRCPWVAVGAHGFDMQHLETVHERILREPPVVERLDEFRLQLRYVSRVAGHGASDRAMRRLSNDRIVVTITCWGGTVLVVESDLGRTRSAIILSIMPTADGVEVRPLFGVPRRGENVWGRGALDGGRMMVARWLFSSFLARDVAILNDIHFAPRLRLPEDEALCRYLEFVRELPEVEGDYVKSARKGAG